MIDLGQNNMFVKISFKGCIAVQRNGPMQCNWCTSPVNAMLRNDASARIAHGCKLGLWNSALVTHNLQFGGNLGDMFSLPCLVHTLFDTIRRRDPQVARGCQVTPIIRWTICSVAEKLDLSIDKSSVFFSLWLSFKFPFTHHNIMLYLFLDQILSLIILAQTAALEGTTVSLQVQGTKERHKPMINVSSSITVIREKLCWTKMRRIRQKALFSRQGPCFACNARISWRSWCWCWSWRSCKETIWPERDGVPQLQFRVRWLHNFSLGQQFQKALRTTRQYQSSIILASRRNWANRYLFCNQLDLVGWANNTVQRAASHDTADVTPRC